MNSSYGYPTPRRRNRELVAEAYAYADSLEVAGLVVSLPAGYRAIVLEGEARTNYSFQEGYCALQFNEDSAAIYTWTVQRGYGTNMNYFSARNQVRFDYLLLASTALTAAGRYSRFWVTLPNYDHPGQFKVAQASSAMLGQSGLATETEIAEGVGVYKSLKPIQSVKITNWSGTALVAGSYLRAYGIWE